MLVVLLGELIVLEVIEDYGGCPRANPCTEKATLQCAEGLPNCIGIVDLL